MLDRTKAPDFVAPKKFTLPEPGKISFDNGSQLYFLKVGEQPVIKLEFIFKAGSWFEGIHGTAFFTSKMLLEGTLSFDSKSIAEKLDSYGAFVEINPGFDYVNVSIHVPARHFDKIENLLSEILFEPAFHENEFDLMKQIQIQHLKVNEQKNNFVGSRLFRKHLFGDSPYGHIMTEDSIKRISTENLKSHFELWMLGRFDIFLTGNFENDLPERISRLVQNRLKSLNGFHKIENNEQPRFEEYFVREDSLQSSVFIGKKSINRTHSDYSGLLLLNEVFGGYFGSRLMQNIREDKGYTYSIYSHVATLKNDAYFIINSEVKKENRVEVVEQIDFEIEKIKNEIISKKELIQVKNYLKGSILNSLTTSFAITEKLKNIIFYDLEMNFYDQLFDQIDMTNEEELMSLANNLLFDQPLSSVIVG